MWFGLLLLMSSVSLLSCMDSQPNFDECVEIEQARCDVRDRCLGNKAFDKAYPDFDLDTCSAYSEEHCRTRKIKGKGWNQKDIKACVQAINGLVCTALIPRGVDETETLPVCDFIEAPLDEDEKETDSGLGDTDTGSEGDTDTGSEGDTDTTSPGTPTDIFNWDAGIQIPL